MGSFLECLYGSAKTNTHQTYKVTYLWGKQTMFGKQHAPHWSLLETKDQA